MKSWELSAMVNSEYAEELLSELADDPRVLVVHVKKDDGVYLVPARDAVRRARRRVIASAPTGPGGRDG